jgi:hypothetical protein
MQHRLCSQVSTGAAKSSRRGAAQSRVVDTSRRSTAALVDSHVKRSTDNFGKTSPGAAQPAVGPTFSGTGQAAAEAAEQTRQRAAQSTVEAKTVQGQTQQRLL